MKKEFDIKKSQKQFLDKYKKEKIIIDLKVNDDELLKYSSIVKKAVDNYQNCQKSTSSCPNGGFHYVLYRNKNNELDLRIEECKKIESENEFKKIINNYVLREITTVDYNLSTSDFSKQKNIIQELEELVRQNKSIYIFNEKNDINELISAITNSLAKQNYKIAFLNMIDFSTYATTISFDKTTNLLQLIDVLKNVDLLVLDEVGNEKFQRFINTNILYAILNHRSITKKPNIFISQFEIKDLKKRYELQASFKEKTNIEHFIKKIENITNKTRFKL